MAKLVNLVQRILRRHIDPNTGIPEAILLGWCDSETASEHISRYILASRLARGMVLNVASGSCYGSGILERSSNVQRVVNVDIDEDLILFGARVYSATGLVADATQLPFREESFDTVVSLETLEHIKDQERFIQNIRSSLRKGGYLILSTPNKLYTSPLLPKPLNPYHEREYYLGELITYLSLHGFKVLGIYGCGRVTWPRLVMRIFSSIMKFILSRLSRRTIRLIDKLYFKFVSKLWGEKNRKLIDPNPEIYPCTLLKTASNICFCQDFVIHAVKL